MASHKLEAASAELAVAETFTQSADNFLDEIKQWLKLTGQASALAEAGHLEIMLVEISGKLREAKALIDECVAANFLKA